MLATPVILHDIASAEGFVRGTIAKAERGGMALEHDEREELVSEGLTILYELAGTFDAHRPGYETSGRFSGYAAMFLPRRLGDAWHRSHPEHRYVTDHSTGRRVWHYDPPAVSLDAITDARTNRGGEDRDGDHQLAKARGLRDFVPVIAAQATAANFAAATAPA